MDTSETYIKMCEKAMAIQVFFEGKTGDLVFNKGRTLWVGIGGKQAESIWLPRQDQLQEMVGDFDSQMIIMKSCYHFDYMEDELFSEPLSVTSMEQLWLAFVMHEKYGRKWDGENWI